MTIKLEPIEMDRRQANRLAKDYEGVGSAKSRALTTSRGNESVNETALAQIDAGLHQTYLALGEGKKVIDIRQVFEDAGQDSKQRPNIALARADWRSVRCTRGFNGDLRFVDPIAEESKLLGRKSFVLPSGTLPTVVGRFQRDSFNAMSMVPAIPPKLRPDSLSEYAMIWEVFDWSGEPRALPSRWSAFRDSLASKRESIAGSMATLDPILLRSLGGPLYVVIAAWDLTPIEATIIGSL